MASNEELQAAVERLTLATKTYVPSASYRRGSETENNDALAADLRLILAALEARGKALADTADYLEALEDNLLRNDADMLLDDCESPREIAEGLRALTALGGTADVCD